MRTAASRLTTALATFAQIEPQERRAVALAFACNFMLLGSYYILRPLRDSMATVFGVGQLQNLFTLTFVFAVLCSPIYSALASRLKLTTLLPGAFWFWLLNVVLFYGLFALAPASRWVAGAYYVWFSVVNLIMISVFWSLMVDLFSVAQATRLFALIAAGGSLGAIGGSVLTRLYVPALGLTGLLLLAAAGLAVVIGLIYWLMREKERLRLSASAGQTSSLRHRLAGNPLEGFGELLRSAYQRHQAAFMLFMTWASTVAYFFQTDLISKAFAGIERRTEVIADIDLMVNVASALIMILGVGRLIRKFGVTTGLVLNPVIMLVAFSAIALAPTVLMIQAVQVVRRVSQYAIARPSREICFTVVPQESRYKAKNVIDTVIYRLGDVTAAWLVAALRWAGTGLMGTVALGLAVSAAWAVSATRLGRRFEVLRRKQAIDPLATASD
jgi:ATP:ADP antiporter, AAA family